MDTRSYVAYIWHLVLSIMFSRYIPIFLDYLILFENKWVKGEKAKPFLSHTVFITNTLLIQAENDLNCIKHDRITTTCKYQTDSIVPHCYLIVKVGSKLFPITTVRTLYTTPMGHEISVKEMHYGTIKFLWQKNHHSQYI